ncbi:two-component sensor histidine kinase [Reticulibacter mediterranei]|uniref:histidine kinase n=1 Tax=Reticulibacter mediterranei TaxID=2778369 RepID=A0A8J3N093_9CHLR|nr:ATP-binding protein [Reticulibacter mediterranei]GHO93984.1 two-component sensor histidine kinase [Reticulibacter mediterranei]
MKRRSPVQVIVRFFSTVRTRLTLWYLAVIAVIMVVFGGSLYASQMIFNASTAANQLETRLSQETQRLEHSYKQALLKGQMPANQQLTLSEDEIVLLLSPDGNILDQHGPLTNDTTQQLLSSAQSGLATYDLAISQSNDKYNNGWWNNWHGKDTNYHILITPILNSNARIGTLIVGLVPQYPFPLLWAWFFHALMGLLFAAIGGYWLAGKALRPVRTITRMANEIHASDLRRRLHLERQDEFGDLAATFDQMLARLEAAFKRQTQFTADASHELRTPLTIINLEINRALTQLQRPDEYQQVLELIQAENEQMTAIVNSLLLLARADTGQIMLHQEEVDLSDIALACVERLWPLAKQRNISLSMGELPELLVSGDPHYLGRMLTNLIENAIKYTSGVGKRVHVELACEEQRRGIIRVQDDGPGIAEEHLPYLFDRFYRVDKARTRKQRQAGGEEVGGTGLGLAIVQWIVRVHGGEVRVVSMIGAGSIFEVRLPLRSCEPEQPSSLEAVSHGAGDKMTDR